MARNSIDLANSNLLRLKNDIVKAFKYKSELHKAMDDTIVIEGGRRVAPKPSLDMNAPSPGYENIERLFENGE